MNQQITVFSRLPMTQDIWHGSYRHDSNVESEDGDVHEILESIKKGTFKGPITLLRDLKKADSPRYDDQKRTLPYIMFAGTFSEYSSKGLKSISGLACLDLDHIPDSEYQSEWERIIADPYTFAAFMSPSGQGIKILVQLENDTSKETHKEYVEALRRHYDSPYWDPCSNQLIRGCFMTYDPDLYLNDSALTWTEAYFGPTPMFDGPVPPKFHAPLDFIAAGRAIHVMEGGWSKYAPMTPGNRHNSSFLRAREMAEHGITEEYAQEYIMGFVDDSFTEYEASKQVREAYQKTRDAGKFGTKAFNYKPKTK